MVTFYELNSDGTPKVPVLYLDTLKVSTIEQTSENTDARGGKGNAALISWDYGKEINVTLEDALFSAKSLAIMFGNGTVNGTSADSDSNRVMRTETFTAVPLTGSSLPSTSDDGGWKAHYVSPDGTKQYAKLNPKFYDEAGKEVVASTPSGNQVQWVQSGSATYFCSYDLVIDGGYIDVSANSFPGTYYVTGDTYARNAANGKDEFFQFIIPKAKVQSENTITLEAEGDPSVFNMSLKVLRPDDGVMMKLVKYDLTSGSEVGATGATEIKHNHYLDPKNEQPWD